MTTLTQFGWGQAQHHFYTTLGTTLLPGRVCSIKGFKYFVITENGELETELSGKLLFENENEFLPKTGDWVLVTAYDNLGFIVEVFPRTNALTRKNPGRKTDVQVLATNIDYAIVVQSLDTNFNLMRLDRYLVQIINCNIKPIVILNKADLVPDVQRYIDEVNRLQRDVPVIVCSTVDGRGFAELEAQVFLPGKTCVLIGSSGVGKSSILNKLMEEPVQLTATMSDFNNKGRHTTTTRELFRLTNGALVVDTPGMREFGVTPLDDANRDEEFPALSALAVKCRYSDCKHLNETGCAVLAALQDGSLDPVIYDSYIKLMKEQRRFTVSVEEKKQRARQFGKILKEAKLHRRKYKY